MHFMWSKFTERLLLLIITASFVLGCHKGGAKDLLREAKDFADGGNYPQALILLDSLDKTFPDELRIRQEGLSERKRIYRERNQQRISEIPFLLDSLSLISDSLRQGVEISSDGREYGMPACFSSALRTDHQGVQALLKCDTLGFPTLEVIYVGTRPCPFESLKISTADSTLYISPISENEFLDYHTHIGNRHYVALSVPPRESSKIVNFFCTLPEDVKPEIVLLSVERKELFRRKLDVPETESLKRISRLSATLSASYQLRQEYSRRKDRYRNEKLRGKE